MSEMVSEYFYMFLPFQRFQIHIDLRWRRWSAESRRQAFGALGPFVIDLMGLASWKPSILRGQAIRDKPLLAMKMAPLAEKMGEMATGSYVDYMTLWIGKRTINHWVRFPSRFWYNSIWWWTWCRIHGFSARFPWTILQRSSSLYLSLSLYSNEMVLKAWWLTTLNSG